MFFSLNLILKNKKKVNLLKTYNVKVNLLIKNSSPKKYW